MTVPAGLVPGADAIAEGVRRQGFLLLPSIFDPELAWRVATEMDQARVDEERRFGATELDGIGQRGYTCDVPGMGPATRELLDAEPLALAVDSVLGPDARLSVAQGIVLDPGQGRGSWPRTWHADLFGIRQALPDPDYCFGINALVAIDQMTVKNGATCVVPGSHGLVRSLADGGAEMESICTSVVAPAGSLILMDGGLWHAAGTNDSDAPRRVLKLLFVRPWVRPQLDYASLIDGETRRQVSPRVAGYLGLGSDLTGAPA